jgi:hypothetical protein
MKKRTLAALALGAGLIGFGSAQAAEKPGGFSGTWSVQLVTEAGICDRSFSYAIVVNKGQVRAAGGATVTGQIGSNGNVNLGVHRGSAKADVFGRLRGNAGSGTWQVPMVGCSGHWTAQRRTATADRSS